MKCKLEDARTVVKREKWANTTVWREETEVLRWNGVSERFFVIWEKEKAERRNDLKKKLEKKVQHLYNREREKRNTEGERDWVVRGINVDDKQLNGDVFEARPRVYGNSERLLKNYEQLMANFHNTPPVQYFSNTSNIFTFLRLMSHM